MLKLAVIVFTLLLGACSGPSAADVFKERLKAYFTCTGCFNSYKYTDTKAHQNRHLALLREMALHGPENLSFDFYRYALAASKSQDTNYAAAFIARHKSDPDLLQKLVSDWIRIENQEFSWPRIFGYGINRTTRKQRIDESTNPAEWCLTGELAWAHKQTGQKDEAKKLREEAAKNAKSGSEAQIGSILLAAQFHTATKDNYSSYWKYLEKDTIAPTLDAVNLVASGTHQLTKALVPAPAIKVLREEPLLWQLRASVGVREIPRQTFAHKAVAEGDVSKLKELIAAGYLPDGMDTAQQRPLHGVVHGNQNLTDEKRVEMAGILLSAGADPNARDPMGWSPFVLSVILNDTDLVPVLAAGGANLEVTITEVGARLVDTKNHHLTPLLLSTAMATNHDYAIKSTCSVLKALSKAGANLTAKSPSGLNAIALAANRGVSAEVVKTLVDIGVDVNDLGPQGKTPIFRAVETAEEAVIQVLLENGADVNHRDEEGRNLIFTALSYGRSPKVFDLLVTAGADPAAKNTKNETAFHVLASSKGNETSEKATESWQPIEIAKLLLKAGVGIDITDAQGRTPLMVAAANIEAAKPITRKEKLDSSLFSFFLDSGADIYSRDSAGKSFLTYAKDNHLAQKHLSRRLSSVDPGTLDVRDVSDTPEINQKIRELESMLFRTEKGAPSYANMLRFSATPNGLSVRIANDEYDLFAKKIRGLLQSVSPVSLVIKSQGLSADYAFSRWFAGESGHLRAITDFSQAVADRNNSSATPIVSLAWSEEGQHYIGYYTIPDALERKARAVEASNTTSQPRGFAVREEWEGPMNIFERLVVEYALPNGETSRMWVRPNGVLVATPNWPFAAQSTSTFADAFWPRNGDAPERTTHVDASGKINNLQTSENWSPEHKFSFAECLAFVPLGDLSMLKSEKGDSIAIKSLFGFSHAIPISNPDSEDVLLGYLNGNVEDTLTWAEEIHYPHHSKNTRAYSPSQEQMELVAQLISSRDSALSLDRPKEYLDALGKAYDQRMEKGDWPLHDFAAMRMLPFHQEMPEEPQQLPIHIWKHVWNYSWLETILSDLPQEKPAEVREINLPWVFSRLWAEGTREINGLADPRAFLAIYPSGECVGFLAVAESSSGSPSLPQIFFRDKDYTANKSATPEDIATNYAMYLAGKRNKSTLEKENISVLASPLDQEKMRMPPLGEGAPNPFNIQILDYKSGEISGFDFSGILPSIAQISGSNLTWWFEARRRKNLEFWNDYARGRVEKLETEQHRIRVRGGEPLSIRQRGENFMLLQDAGWWHVSLEIPCATGPLQISLFIAKAKNETGATEWFVREIPTNTKHIVRILHEMLDPSSTALKSAGRIWEQSSRRPTLREPEVQKVLKFSGTKPMSIKEFENRAKASKEAWRNFVVAVRGSMPAAFDFSQAKKTGGSISASTINLAPPENLFAVKTDSGEWGLYKGDYSSATVTHSDVKATGTYFFLPFSNQEGKIGIACAAAWLAGHAPDYNIVIYPWSFGPQRWGHATRGKNLYWINN